MKTGVLVVNLGTPDAPTPSALRKYLAEFLWDPRVVEIPRVIWWLILHGVILRTRPAKSAEAYQRIWGEEGSPLLVISRRVSEKIRNSLQTDDPEMLVELAMRYGTPSMTEGLSRFRQAKVDKIIVLPLYPQYASASTGSVYDELIDITGSWRHVPEISFISEYHADSLYIDALVRQIRAFHDSEGKSELLLFSYHGLPARSRRQGDPYYDQCVATSQLLAGKLGLDEKEWKIVFQSRFGREEWLKPYCSETLQQLPKDGVSSVDVVCPGFAADCLETLDEIAVENRELFIEAGGKQFRYIPALNDNDDHISALLQIIQRRL